MTRSIHDTLKSASHQLTAISDSARLDAEILLMQVLGKPRSYLHAWPEQSLSPDQDKQFTALIEQRRKGITIAHLTGRREFWSLELKVTADTLIPRPETETLVEQALQLIPDDAVWNILDLGTGSGAIALALASERRKCRIIATDYSGAALAVAQENAKRLQIDNITWIQGDWFQPLAGRRFGLIVSNPPYIPTNDPHLQKGDLRFEPSSALTAGEDGLRDLRHLITQSHNYLCDPGWLLLEHGYDQSRAVVELLKDGYFSDIASHTDASGHLRVTKGKSINTKVLPAG